MPAGKGYGNSYKGGNSKGRSYSHKAGSGTKSGSGYKGGMPSKESSGYVNHKGHADFSEAGKRLANKKI